MKHKRILVVDDDPDILDAVRYTLEDESYDVMTSIKGDVVENLPGGAGTPDLIILDVLLSGQDGRAICRKLKNKQATRDIPIIMISAHPDASVTVKQVGADDFLAKPFEVSQLLRTVAGCLQRTHAVSS